MSTDLTLRYDPTPAELSEMRATVIHFDGTELIVCGGSAGLCNLGFFRPLSPVETLLYTQRGHQAYLQCGDKFKVDESNHPYFQDGYFNARLADLRAR